MDRSGNQTAMVAKGARQNTGSQGKLAPRIVIGVGDIAVSSGSACASASATPSHVLSALMGAANVPSASIRFGLGRFTTDDDVAYAVEKFTTVVRHLRQLSPARS